MLSKNLVLSTFLFADGKVIIKRNEDDSQRHVFKLNTTTKIQFNDFRTQHEIVIKGKNNITIKLL